MKNSNSVLKSLWKAGLISSFLLSTVTLADFSSSLQNAQSYYPSSAGYQNGATYEGLTAAERKTLQDVVVSQQVAEEIAHAKNYSKGAAEATNAAHAANQQADDRLTAVQGDFGQAKKALKRLQFDTTQGGAALEKSFNQPGVPPECGQQLPQGGIRQTLNAFDNDFNKKRGQAIEELTEEAKKSANKGEKWRMESYAKLSPLAQFNPDIQSAVKKVIMENAAALASGKTDEVLAAMVKISKGELTKFNAARALWVETMYGKGGVFDKNKEADKQEEALADAAQEIPKATKILDGLVTQTQQIMQANVAACYAQKQALEKEISKFEAGLKVQEAAGTVTQQNGESQLSHWKEKAATVVCQSSTTDPTPALTQAISSMNNSVKSATSVFDLEAKTAEGDLAFNQGLQQAAQIQSQPSNPMLMCKHAVELSKLFTSNSTRKETIDLGKDGRPLYAKAQEEFNNAFGGAAGAGVAMGAGQQSPQSIPLGAPGAAPAAGQRI